MDKLQAAVPRSEPPWYRQASIWVAVFALVISMISSYYAYQQTARQNERAARTELGQLIQRLSALPKENAELSSRYAHNRAVFIGLSGAINAENLVLAQQAADVIDRIPDQVSGTEYLTVAEALVSSSYYARSNELIDRGLQTDSDPTTYEGLLRLKSKLLFQRGDIAEGRAQLQRALNVWSGEPAADQATGHVYTEIFWAGLEREAGSCREARIHLAQARAAADNLRRSAVRDRLAASVRAAAIPCA